MKNKLAFAFFIFLAIYQSTLYSAEVYWMKLKPNFTYKDLSIYCSTYSSLTSLYLAMEVSEGKVSRAIFRKGLSFPWESLELSKQEALNIQLKTSNQNQLSIEEISLNAPTLTWVLKSGGGGEMGCHPSQPILSINPTSFTFKFVANPGRPSKELFSNGGQFNGKLKNGDSFSVELQFTQSAL